MGGNKDIKSPVNGGGSDMSERENEVLVLCRRIGAHSMEWNTESIVISNEILPESR